MTRVNESGKCIPSGFFKNCDPLGLGGGGVDLPSPFVWEGDEGI